VGSQQAALVQTAASALSGARPRLTVYSSGGEAEEEAAVRALLARTIATDRYEIARVAPNTGTRVCGEVRFFSDSDAAAAKEVVDALNRAMRAAGDPRPLQVADRRGAAAGDGRGTLEVWLPPQTVPPPPSARWGDSRLVHGGCATLGSDQQGRDTLRKVLGAPDAEWFASELPAGRPWVDAFFIGRTEVTAGAFAEYQRDCQQKRGADCPPWKPRFLDPQREPRRPAAFVSWVQARDYCAWAGGRLPTDLEWEKAARGPEGRFWPWGFEADDRLFQGRTRNPRAPVAVGSFSPQGDSPYGVGDLAGNVWEFTADLWKPGQAGHTIRGGSYLNTLLEARSSVRWASSLEQSGAEYLGFRCVAELRR
jgi:hypothetical protein